MELEGRIVEFLDSGTLHVGYVRKHDRNKVQIVDRRGRQSSVPAPRVAIVHQAVSETEFPEAARLLLERVGEYRSEIDVELLWESVNSEVRDFTLRELAEAYFGETSAPAEAALFRELEQAPLFFKLKNIQFQPRSEEQVARERLRKEREQERQDFRQQVEELLRGALGNAQPPESQLWTEVVDRLDAWLRHRSKDEVGEILERVTSTARARSKAYEILLGAGKVKAGEDRFLLIRGIHPEFPVEAVAACNALSWSEADPDRLDLTSLAAIAIDDEDTREVDDALTVQDVGGETVVGVHIADVSTFVRKGDPLDREASRRSATIYLPNVSVMMFPDRLATDLASLVQGSPRPAFTFEARFDSENVLSGYRIRRSVIQVSERLSYEEADRALGEGHSVLERLHGIAMSQLAMRQDMGAQTHRRPELKVRVRGDEISVRQIDTNSSARQLVSEMMILANRLAADQAAASRVPIIFRTQEPPDSVPEDLQDLPEPLQFDQRRRSFKRSRLSLTPGEHSGLGLRAYAQISSPIRRYSDLVTQLQFASALANEPLPFGSEELLRVLTTAEAAELENRRLEEESTTYWVLKYLAREEMNRPLRALLLDRKGNMQLTDYLVRGRVSDKQQWKPGEGAMVEIESIDLERQEIRFRPAE